MRPREYKTKAMVSTSLGIPLGTLELWELLPGWWDSVFADARRVIGRELGDILQAMVKRAKGGSVPAAKLCLQALDVQADKIRIEGEMQSQQLLLILSPDQMDEHEGSEGNA
jgi:hypothetical protein